MKPLATLAWGLLLVVLDVRVDGFDLLPDPLGWCIGAYATGSLARGMSGPQTGAPWFRVAAVACAAATLPAIPGWFGAEHPLITLVDSVAETVVVFATCTGIMTALPWLRPTANAVRWSDLGTLAVLLVLMAIVAAVPSVAPLAILAGVATLVVFVWFLVLLFRASKPFSLPPGP